MCHMNKGIPYLGKWTILHVTPCQGNNGHLQYSHTIPQGPSLLSKCDGIISKRFKHTGKHLIYIYIVKPENFGTFQSIHRRENFLFNDKD